MRRALVYVFCSLLCLPSPVLAQDNLKIGYVDLQKALNEAEAGKKSQGEL